jgi:hypothetical protein
LDQIDAPDHCHLPLPPQAKPYPLGARRDKAGPIQGRGPVR